MITTKRIVNVMQKHMLHSSHAALCYIEAERRERLKARREKRRATSTRTTNG